MDYQVLFNIVLGAFGALAMFMIAIMYKKIEQLADENRELLLKLGALQILVAGNYVTRTEMDTKIETLLTTLTSTITNRLTSIDDKLDRRART